MPILCKCNPLSKGHEVSISLEDLQTSSITRQTRETQEGAELALSRMEDKQGNQLLHKTMTGELGKGGLVQTDSSVVFFTTTKGHCNHSSCL